MAMEISLKTLLCMPAEEAVGTHYMLKKKNGLNYLRVDSYMNCQAGTA